MPCEETQQKSMAHPGPFLDLKHALILWSLLLVAHVVLYLQVTWRIKRGKEDAIRLPPSPPRLPIIGHLHLIVKNPHESLQRLARTLGPVIHLQLGGVPAVVVSSPEAAREVLKTHDVHCCSRPSAPGARLLTYNQEDIAFSPYNEGWRQKRKLFISELVGGARVKANAHVLEDEVGKLIQSLSLSSSPKEPVNLNEKVFALVDGFVGTVAFGSMSGAKLLKYGQFQQVFSEAMAALSAFSAQDFFPRSAISPWVDKLVGLEARYRRIFEELDAYFETVLQQHMDPNRVTPEKDDLVGVLVSLYKGQGKGPSLTRDHLKAIIMDAFLGGTATSSVTVLWAMSELIKNPRVMKKVQSEIRNALGDRSRVEVNDIGNFKYLKMVHKETLRLHPPAPLLIPRETIKHVKVLGYDIPQKTRIFVNVWAIGRDPAYWDNPEEFNPERFENTDIDFHGSHFELVPFGAGRRICPAMTMGVRNVEFILASLLHSFDWQLPDGMASKDVSMEGFGRQVFYRKIPLYLVPSLHKRN